MSSEKISALPSHTLNSADIIPVANGGANYGDTVGQIETAAAALVHWSTLLGDLAETQVIPFDGGTPGTADTGISRLGAASLAVGNGTARDFSGNVSLNSILFGNNAASALSYNPSGVLGRPTIVVNVAGGLSTGDNNLNGIGLAAGVLVLGINAGIYWNLTGDLNYPIDTGISRLGAGSLAIGNGTLGDKSGNISAQTHTVTASSGAPTSAGTAGTIGQIIAYGGFLYYCSVTGGAGSATWNKLTMTAV